MRSAPARKVAEEARAANRRIGVTTYTTGGERAYTGHVVGIATEIGGRRAAKLVLAPASGALLVIGFTTITHIEILPSEIEL